MDTLLETLKGIYLGDRGLAFKTLIVSVLKKGKIKDKYINILTTNNSINIYSEAFTSELVDENNNYQVYEQMGDLTGNKFIVWYIYRRFPQLKCSEGVKVAARLRINYGAKQSFFQIAESLGFWDFITATNDLRQRKKKSLLEDVFEAFLGATESIIDDKCGYGVGYALVYKVLSAIFDSIDISLDYEKLYDAKTRLKELFDLHSSVLGILVYEECKEELITYSHAYRLDGAQKGNGKYIKILIGRGSAALKADAQQAAATDALKNLASQGFYKRAPTIYAKFSNNITPNGETTKNSVLKIIGNVDAINEQFPTRGKFKYQNKYTSTVLGKYCRERDYKGITACLSMGAHPNIRDSEGLSALDLLLIGNINGSFVTKVIDCFLKVETPLDIHRDIFEIYYKKYNLDYGDSLKF